MKFDRNSGKKILISLKKQRKSWRNRGEFENILSNSKILRAISQEILKKYSRKTF